MTGLMLPRRQRRGSLPPAGLLAYYDFMQDAGNPQRLPDLSGNGRYGTLGTGAGADVSDPVWTAQGLQFDGSNDYVSVAPLLSLSGAHTAVAVHTPIAGSAAYPAVYVQDSGAARDRASLLYWDKASGGYCGQRSVGTTSYTTSPVPAPTGAAHIIVLSYDGTKISVQVDGGATQTKVAPSPTGASARLWIGNNGAGSVTQGTLHALAFYNRLLSAGEQQQVIRALRSVVAPRGVALPAP